jgi:hypothetical protein
MSELLEEFYCLRELLQRREFALPQRLKKSINLQETIDEFPRFQELIGNITESLALNGLPPFRVRATHWTNPNLNSSLEVSWLRPDLIDTPYRGESRSPVSHAPAFRLDIRGGGVPTVEMSSRHNLAARNIFIKNVLSAGSSIFIQDCLELTAGGNWHTSVRWTNEETSNGMNLSRQVLS